MSDTTHTIDLITESNSDRRQMNEQGIKGDLYQQDTQPSGPSNSRQHSPDAKKVSDDLSETRNYPCFSGDLPWSERSWLYEVKPFRGMYYDVRRRLPFLPSDWTTAFHPKNWWTVFQYIPRMYFINLMPAISYIIDMNHRTGGAYGLNEVILASALAAIVFPVFSVQPLTFVGVTGLINLVNYTQYDIVVGYYGLSRIDYLRVQAWSLIWAAGFHFIVSIFNICDFTRFITDMTSQTFGFYVGIVYIQKGIELLLLEFEPSPLDNATGWLSVTIAILFTVSVYLVTAIGRTSFLPFKIRYFISSFAFAAGCIFWTGFSHFPKNSLNNVPIERLPITRSFFPSIDRPWFIDFWNIQAKWAFVGAPFGFLIMLLFYFDHNVSSVMAQARQFPVKRPAGFHWDFFLLGITTLVSGFLGLPAPNGLVPQCPWSTEALSVYKQVETSINDEETKPLNKKKRRDFNEKRSGYAKHDIVNTRVVENRLGHLIVGLLTLGTMTRPLLVVLGTMPRALFAGIFLLVGWSSIEGNIITIRTLAVFQDRNMASDGNPLSKLPRYKIALFVGIQWLFFSLTIAISQTIAAIGFPVIITLLIPFRYYIVPKWFTPDELRILDAPTADADVVLASIGQETEAVTGQGQRVARDTGIAGTEWSPDDDSDSDEENEPHHSRGRLATADQHIDAPAYIIKSDDDDDEELNYREKDVLPSDRIAHSADMGGGLHSVASSEQAIIAPMTASPPAPELVGTPLDAIVSNKSSSSSTGSPQKNNKRMQSATKGWWSLDENKPVERAPTPVKPVEKESSAAPSARVSNAASIDRADGLVHNSEDIKNLPREEKSKSGNLLKRVFSRRGSSKKSFSLGVGNEDQEKIAAAPKLDPIPVSSKGETEVPSTATAPDPTTVEEKEAAPKTSDVSIPAISPADKDIQSAIDDHMAQHFEATRSESTGTGLVAIKHTSTTTSEGKEEAEDASTNNPSILAARSKGASSKIGAAPALTVKEALVDPPSEEIAPVLKDDAINELPPVREGAIPARESSKADDIVADGAAILKKEKEDPVTRSRREASIAAAETMAIAEANRKKAEEEKKKDKESKKDEKKKKEEEKKKAKTELEAAKKREKEEAKLKKEEAALQKKRDKAEALRKKLEAKEAKERETRMEAENRRRIEAEKRRAAIDVKTQKLGKEKEAKEAALAAVVASTAAATVAAEKKDKENKKKGEIASAELNEVAQKRKAEEEALATAAKEKDALSLEKTTLTREKETLESDVALLQAGKMNVLNDFEATEKAKREEAEKIRKQQENDFALIQAGKMNLLSEYEAAEKAKQEESAKKRAEEEAALTALTKDKEEAKEDLALIQAGKEKELADMKEKEEAIERERVDRVQKEEAELAAKREKEEAERQEQLKKEEMEREEKLKREEAERVEALKREDAEREEKLKKEEAEREEMLKKEESERQEAIKKEEEERAAKAEADEKERAEKAQAEEKAKIEQLEKEANERKKKHEEEAAALAALIASREAAAKEVDAVKENKEAETAEVAKLRQEQEKLQEETNRAKKEADEEVTRLAKEKEALEKETADKREKEEAALALIITKQKTSEKEAAEAREREEAEAAKRKEAEEKVLADIADRKAALQREIEELENKARTARLFLAPVKVSKNDLKPMIGQVAGHEASLYSLSNDALVVKSSSLAESSFYQNVLIHHTATTRKSQIELLNKLAKYLPTYHGTIDIAGESTEETHLAIILENLTKKYKHANVLDIKLGKQLYDEEATAEKKKRMEEAARSSTSYLTGLRLTGWQVWDNTNKQYVKVGKRYGKSIRDNQIPVGLRHFFGVASDEDATSIEEIGGENVPAVALPEKRIERILHDGVIPSVKEIVDIVKKLEWRVRGGSLLIIYEGDAEEVSKIDSKNSNVLAGRRSTDIDQLIDTNKLNEVVIPESGSRLVDVRLIDFAHATFGKEKGSDEGYLAGLDSTRRQLEELYKALHRGNLRNKDNTLSDDASRKSSGVGFFGGLLRRDSSKNLIRKAPLVVTEPMPVKKDAKIQDAKAKAKGTAKGKGGGGGEAAAKEVSPIEKKSEMVETSPLEQPVESTPIKKKKRKSVAKEELEVTPLEAAVAVPVIASTEAPPTERPEVPTKFVEEETTEKPSRKSVDGKRKSLDAKKANGGIGGKTAGGGGGIMGLFSTGLTDDSRKVTKEAHPKQQGESFDEIRRSMDAKQNDRIFPMTLLKREASIKSNKSKGKGKGKGKAKEVSEEVAPLPSYDSNKLESFWKLKGSTTPPAKEEGRGGEGERGVERNKDVKEMKAPSVKSEELVADETIISSSRSAGPRKFIRHENPRRGAGKSPPAVQFRSVGEDL